MNNDNRDQQTALIGLALGQAEPVGRAPDLLEIDQWIRGDITLGSSRRREVQSHLANSASSFSQWRALMQAQLWLDENDLDDSRKLASLGVALGHKQPLGTKPDLLEIDQWSRGKISQDRASEVLSHVANDPECFSHWRSLREAQDWLDNEESELEIDDELDLSLIHI